MHNRWVCGLGQHSLSLAKCVAASPVVRGLGTDFSPVHRVDMARKWHNIKNKKQICLCPSRLPGIKRLSFQHSASWGLTQWLGNCFYSSTPRLLGRVYATPAFWPGILWKDEFPPECTTMLLEARARARACCDVNLMTSCCSDRRSKQPNKGIVVFLLHFVGEGAPLPVLLLSSGHQTVEPVWVQWSSMLLPKEQRKIPSLSTWCPSLTCPWVFWS